MNENRKLWNVAEAAEYLGIAQQTVRGYCCRTNKIQIPHVKIGKRLLFDKIELDRWIESKKVCAA